MQGQIPQALNQLTAYLQQENARLTQEKRRQDLDLTVDQVSERFKQLGPNATQEDARALFFDTVRIAAQNDAQEAIPFIQGMYNDTMKYVEVQKALRQDEAFKQSLHDRYGIDVGDNLTAEAAAKMLQLEWQSSKDLTKKNKEGQTLLQRYRLDNTGQYQANGEPIMIDPTTNAQRLSFQLQIANARRRAQGLDRMQKSTYMVNVRQPDGSIIQVPASFDPPSGNYFYKIGDKRYLADSSNPNVVGGFSKWESPTIIKARNREEAESQVNWAKNNLVRDASPIAAFIRNQSDMPDELKKELRNIDNPDLNKNAPGTIMNLMEAPAEEGNMLLHYIAKIDDPYDKQRATAMYNRLAQTYKDVKSADEQYRGFTNTGETGVKDTGDSSIFGLPTADYEWTKKRVIDIMAGGTSKDKTGLQEVIAGMVGKSPEDVGMDDWNELSTFDQVRIQKEIKKYTPK